MPMAADVLQITASAAPACGATGAQKVAIRQAAIETIKAGYDSFIVIGGGSENNVHIVGSTPVYAQTNGYATATAYGNTANAYGSSTTTYSGGQPIFGGSHDQTLVIKLFKEGDEGSTNALSARSILGPNWQEALDSSNNSCLD